MLSSLKAVEGLPLYLGVTGSTDEPKQSTLFTTFISTGTLPSPPLSSPSCLPSPSPPLSSPSCLPPLPSPSSPLPLPPHHECPCCIGLHCGVAVVQQEEEGGEDVSVYQQLGGVIMGLIQFTAEFKYVRKYIHDLCRCMHVRTHIHMYVYVHTCGRRI